MDAVVLLGDVCYVVVGVLLEVEDGGGRLPGAAVRVLLAHVEESEGGTMSAGTGTPSTTSGTSSTNRSLERRVVVVQPMRWLNEGEVEEDVEEVEDDQDDGGSGLHRVPTPYRRLRRWMPDTARTCSDTHLDAWGGGDGGYVLRGRGAQRYEMTTL